MSNEIIDGFKSFWNFTIIKFDDYTLQVYNLIVAALVVLTNVFVLKLIRKALLSGERFQRLDKGTSFAIVQILRYIFWVIAISIVLEVLGFNLTVILASSAALLVGVGLGLQHVFNDFISGVILLIEPTTQVGDILEVEGDVVQIKSIGIRTTLVMNRDDILVVIPNSLITKSKVINWTTQSRKTRFSINVGVAYGSDVEKVMKVLTEAAKSHQQVVDKDKVFARFLNFGNSSLDFEVLFFCENIFRIENVKSDIRVEIAKLFKANNITVPFPQLDVHMK